MLASELPFGGDTMAASAHLAASLSLLASSQAGTESSFDWASLAAAVGASVAGVGAAFAAALTVRQQHRWGATDAFLRISDQFEREAFREYRTIIYTINRDAFASWSDEQVKAVNAWCAHLDLVAILVQTKQVDETAFLNLYGDVFLRTIYQIAPYCNYQIGVRGKQFLLPIRLLTGDLVRIWRKRAKRKRYPLTVGFPAQPQLRVTPDLFDSDDAVIRFRVDHKLK
jgi:hypothetical protein